MYNINVKRIARKLFRLNTEVLVEFGDGSTIGIRKILHQLAFLQQEDAGGDVGNEVEVVAGDDDRGALLLADSLNHVGDSHLRRRVEIVERLIQEKNLRIDDHRSDNANLLSVALREITEILLGSHDFIVHKALKLRQSLLQGLIVDVIDISDEIEVFLRGEEVDEESAVDVTAGIFLPGLTLVHLLSIAFHETIISLNQVENQTEQGSLARTIITYESYQLAICNTQIINIEDGIAIIYLLEILNLDIHYSNV